METLKITDTFYENEIVICVVPRSLGHSSFNLPMGSTWKVDASRSIHKGIFIKNAPMDKPYDRTRFIRFQNLEPDD